MNKDVNYQNKSMDNLPGPVIFPPPKINSRAVKHIEMIHQRTEQIKNYDALKNRVTDGRRMKRTSPSSKKTTSNCNDNNMEDKFNKKQSKLTCKEIKKNKTKKILPHPKTNEQKRIKKTTTDHTKDYSQIKAKPGKNPPQSSPKEIPCPAKNIAENCNLIPLKEKNQSKSGTSLETLNQVRANADISKEGLIPQTDTKQERESEKENIYHFDKPPYPISTSKRKQHKETTHVKLPLLLATKAVNFDIDKTICLPHSMEQITNIDVVISSLNAHVYLPTNGTYVKAVFIAQIEYSRRQDKNFHTISIPICMEKHVFMDWLHAPDNIIRYQNEYTFSSSENDIHYESFESFTEPIETSLRQFHFISHHAVPKDKLLTLQGIAQISIELLQKQYLNVLL